MTAEVKGEHLFRAAKALRETWAEVDRLILIIDQNLLDTFKGSEFTPKRESKDDEDPEESQDIRWGYQYNFKLRKKQRGRPGLALYLDYEFRLCWDGENKIIRSDESEACIPVIVVKGSTKESIGYLDPFASPTERADSDADYQVVDRLLWLSKGGV